MELATDPGLTAALRARGYQVRGPVGLGSRGPVWAATRADGARTVVTVLDLDRTLAERRAALDRIERLRAVEHPHLARLLDVVALDAHRTALVVAAVKGPTVGTMLAVRAPWSAGEVVTLVVPIADALDALHRAGLVHGDVAPENVILGPGGHPVLVDLGGVVLPGSGTRGFAPAGGAASPAGDVFALSRLGLSALGVATGGARTEAGTGALVRALEAGCAEPPPARPTPGELAARCFDAAPAEPVLVPDAAVLTRVALSRLTESGLPDRTLPDPRVLRRRAFVARVAGSLACLGLVIGGGLLLRALAGPAEAGVLAPAAQGGAAPPARPEAPATIAAQAVAAAVGLTERRVVVLASQDPARLAEVTEPGTAAHAADEALMGALVDRTGQLEVHVDVAEARWVASRDGSELVLVTTTHRVGEPATVPEARSVVLALRRTAAGWRVVDVVDPAAVPELSEQVGPSAG